MGTLSHGGGKPQGALADRGKPKHCRWCGERLPQESAGDTRGGYRDNGVFCSLRCGFQFAVLQTAGLRWDR